MIESFYPLFTPRNICCRYFLESPRWGVSNKYPKYMFHGVLNTVFLNISNYLPHLEDINLVLSMLNYLYILKAISKYIELKC